MKVFFGIFLWAWLFGFVVFETFVSMLVPCLVSEPLDGIVVFTGSPGRLHLGIALLKEKRAPRLLISGVESNRQVVLSPEESHLPITLGYQAKNTVENVEETKAWLSAHKVQNAYLVTADYHMPRSLLLLEKNCPDAVFYVCPLKTDWEKRLSYSFLEYHKYIASWAFYALRGVKNHLCGL